MPKLKKYRHAGKLWYAPCRLNRASIGEADFKFIVLTNLRGHPNIPVWAPRGTVQVWPQKLPIGGHLKGYVLAKELSRTGKTLELEVGNEDGPKTITIARKFLISMKEYSRYAKAETRRMSRDLIQGWREQTTLLTA